MKNNADEIRRLKERLGQGTLKTVIIPHISADGDAAGSCSALSEVLQQVGIEWHILTCDFIPEYLRFLKNISSAISFQEKPEECKRLLADADLIFMLDHNTVAREGDLENWVVASPAGRVIIDHHPDPDPQQYVISDTQVSSTCELLYIVMSQIWGKEIVTPDIAGALYTGINTDTGGLSHNSSHPQTYRIIADLLEAGLDKAYIHERIYQMNNLSRLRLIGNVLLNKLEVNEQYPVAIMPITREELDRYNYKDGDLEGLVNIPLSVHNVCVSVQITERRERVKLSFRSKGNVPVNEWAKAFFNGGGHLNAAGGDGFAAGRSGEKGKRNDSLVFRTTKKQRYLNIHILLKTFIVMPFFKFHFVEASRMAGVSRRMADRLQETIGCPREHIVFELIHSSVVADVTIKSGNDWPYVEVDYFERPPEVQHEVAKVIYECLMAAGYQNSDVYFRYLTPENYYENGACLK